MKGLSGLALQLGKDTAFSASEAAAGIEELVKGGLTIPDIMSGAAKATLNLAAAGGVSLPDAATIAANALAQFGLKGKDMAHVADLIAGAANASALDVGQFKFSLQAAGAVAATVGFSFDDLAVAIAEMGKAGIVGSDAGTSLKTMMMSLQPSTKAQKEEFKKLGIVTKDGANRFFDATGKVKSLAEVQQILQDATKGLTQQQKLASLEIMFGSDAIRAAAVLAKEGGAGYRDMAAGMGKVTAESVGLEKLNNLAGDVKTLGGSVETLAITFGTAFLPVLRDATQAATNFVNGLIPWVEQVGPQVISTVQSLVGYFGAVVSTGDHLNDFLADVPAFARPVVEVIGAAVGVVSNLAEALRMGFAEGGVAGAFGRWFEVVRAVGTDLAEQVGLWGETLVGWIAPRIPAVLTALGSFASSIWTWITETAVPTTVARLTEWGGALVGWVAPQIPGLLTALGALATSVWTWITQTALPTITTKLLEWGGAFVNWVTPVVTALPATLGGLKDAVLTWVGETAPPLLDRLGTWKDAFLDWAAPIARAIPGTLAGVASGVWTWITDNAPAILTRLGAWKDQFLAWVTPLLVALPGKLGELKDKALTWIGDAAPVLLAKLGEWKDQFIAWVVPLLTGLPAKLGELKDKAIEWIGENGPALLAKLGEWKDVFLAWVGPLVLALPRKLGEIKDTTVTWITETAIPAMKTAWEKLEPVIVPVIVGALKKAREDLKPVWTDITTFMSDFEPTGKRLERLFDTIGRTLTDTLVPAVKKLWPSGDGQGPSFFHVLADAVNAFSEKWEKAIDGFATSARQINDFYNNTKPFWDGLARLLPGTAGGGLAPAIERLIGGGAGAGGGGGSAPPRTVNVGGGPSPRAGETVVGGPDPANGKYAYQRREGTNTVVEWRDRGGIGLPGHAYAVGVPEIFQPSTPGRFVPLGGASVGESQTIVVPVSIDGQVFTTVTARANRRYAARGGR